MITIKKGSRLSKLIYIELKKDFMQIIKNPVV